MGSDQDVTLGEIARAVGRIEHKVDEQGDLITSVNLRLTAIEAKQDDTPTGRRSARPVAAGAGIGAGLLGLAQWIFAHWTKGTQ